MNFMLRSNPEILQGISVLKGYHDQDIRQCNDGKISYIWWPWKSYESSSKATLANFRKNFDAEAGFQNVAQNFSQRVEFWHQMFGNPTKTLKRERLHKKLNDYKLDFEVMKQESSQFTFPNVFEIFWKFEKATFNVEYYE